VLERVEGRAPAENVERPRVRVPPDRLPALRALDLRQVRPAAPRQERLFLQRQTPSLLRPPLHLPEGRAQSYRCGDGPGSGAGLAAQPRVQRRALSGAGGPGQEADRASHRRAPGVPARSRHGKRRPAGACGGSDSGAHQDQDGGSTGVHREEHHRSTGAEKGAGRKADAHHRCHSPNGIHLEEPGGSVHQLQRAAGGFGRFSTGQEKLSNSESRG